MSVFVNGTWAWNDTINALTFLSKDIDEPSPGVSTPTQPTKKEPIRYLRFKDTIDTLGIAQFRRLFQRKIKPSEPHVVTIQDIKDVAIFTGDRRDLTVEFIELLHTQRMDELLRALIVYFQYYLTVVDNITVRREEAKRKLWQPVVTVLEDIVRDDLADLRSIVARNYVYIIMGLTDTAKYYHMSNKNNVSLSDKDRHFHECLISMATRIVWIALLRKNLSLIDIEMSRIFRTDFFNLVERCRITSAFRPTKAENRVLNGKAYKVEKKLKHRSPAVQELIFDNHDYAMLAIGHCRIEPIDDRTSYLESAYTAPEELLFELEVGVGILGLDKSYLNPILQPKEGMAKRIRIAPFIIPRLSPGNRCIANEILPKTPPLHTENNNTKAVRKQQCKMWRKYAADLLKTEEVSSTVTSVPSTQFTSSLSEDSEDE